jgi:glycosyltransferase involved in cell wall biosynthesis
VRIALIASPFLDVPPPRYGGTELFINDLAVHLQKIGIEVVVYTVGTSTVPVERRSLYRKSRWPPANTTGERLRELRHSGWAMADAHQTCDVVHVNDVPALSHVPLVRKPVVHTLHHPFEEEVADFYRSLPEVQFVAISKSQARPYRLPRLKVIHHGIDFSKYELVDRKQPYLSFLGRLVPVKGAHLAIKVAQRVGLPLKIAGEIQPAFRDYFEREIEPHVDGKSVEYVGEADLRAKNELLGNSTALLFPVLWEEPFGLVAVEAMACGTPVISLRGGAAVETVRHGVSGFLAHSISELAQLTRDAPTISPVQVRQYAEEHFSAERMARDYANLYHGVLGRRDNQVKRITERSRVA